MVSAQPSTAMSWVAARKKRTLNMRVSEGTSGGTAASFVFMTTEPFKKEEFVSSVLFRRKLLSYIWLESPRRRFT